MIKIKEINQLSLGVPLLLVVVFLLFSVLCHKFVFLILLFVCRLSLAKQ